MSFDFLNMFCTRDRACVRAYKFPTEMTAHPQSDLISNVNGRKKCQQKAVHSLKLLRISWSDTFTQDILSESALTLPPLQRLHLLYYYLHCETYFPPSQYHVIKKQKAF